MQGLNIKHSGYLLNLSLVLGIVMGGWLSACTVTDSESNLGNSNPIVESATPSILRVDIPTIPPDKSIPLVVDNNDTIINNTASPQLIWFYKPSKLLNAETLAQDFDFFILTKKDEEYRDALYDINPEFQILQYIRFDAIHDPCGILSYGEREDCSCDTGQPYSNNVAWLPQDLCDIIEYHSDWFLRDKHGKYIISENFVHMDPGNQGWREFWLSRVKYSQEVLGWDGVYLDNVEGSIGWHRVEDAGLLFYDDNSYRQQVNDFLKYIYKGYFEPEGIRVYANIISAEQISTWLAYLQYLDGALNESWAADWHDDYIPIEEWQRDLALVEQIQALGKDAILVTQGSQDDTQRQLFAFASYLLVNSERAYFRYAHSSVYREAWLYENYDYGIGQPINVRYIVKDNIWRRDFTNGFVEVNPEEIAVNIYLDDEYVVKQLN